MRLTNLDLPPPRQLHDIVHLLQIPAQRIWLSVPMHDQDAIISYPHNRVAEWLSWRSTVHRMRYYETYILSYFWVNSNEYTLFVRRKQYIHFEWHANKFEQLI